jgi:hypothetical protein
MVEQQRDELMEQRVRRLEAKFQEFTEALDELLQWVREEAGVDRFSRVA